jgi:predicted GNAT superfamily acetyltransferase
MSDIIIRDLTTYEECLQVHTIQRRCWGFTQDEGIYPPLLFSVSENGGTVLGAFEGDRMIGYVFGYLGLHDPQGKRILKIHSQTMGVLPEYRNKGAAEKLKLAQRDRALALGIELITWTYDPLEGINANLNLHKLGAIARTYKRDVYGENFGQINAGQPTDRFRVEWWITQPRPRISDAGFQIEKCTVTQVEGTGVKQKLVGFDVERPEAVIAIEIPENIQAIRRADLQLAREWRLGTREIFETYLARGYAGVDFISLAGESGRRNYYILARI